MARRRPRLDRQHRLALRLGRARPAVLRPPRRRPAVPQAAGLRRLEGRGAQPDPLLRAPLGAARRPRQRALARRRRAAARTRSSCASTPPASRCGGWPSPRTSRARCSSSRPTRRATSPGTSCASTEASPRDGRAVRDRPNVIGGEERPRRGGGDVREARPGDRRPIGGVARSARATSRRPSTAAPRRAAGLGRAHGRRARGGSCAGSRSLLERDRDEVAAIVAAETGKSPKDALRRGRRRRSRWATSSPARAAASTAARPPSAVAEPPGDDGPPAARRRRPDHRRQHADRERRLEGLPGAAVRQRGGAEGRPRTRRRRRSPSRGSPREAGLPAGVLNVVHGLRRGGGRSRSSSDPRRRRRQLHRLDGGRPADRAASRASGWPRSASSSAARTRSSSATTPTSTQAADAAALSAFCNAGQRCAAGSRSSSSTPSTTRSASCCWSATRAQRVGPGDEHDFGPVINERQLDEHARRGRARARGRGRAVIAGGERLTGDGHDGGFYMAPTLVEGVAPRRASSRARSCSGRSRRCTGSPTSRRRSTLANAPPYGLTAAIWTAQHPPRQEFVSTRASAAWRRSTARPTARAAHAVRRPEGLRQRLARGRHRGAGRLLGLEDRLRQPRPRRACRWRAARPSRSSPRAAGSQARAREERPRARAAIRCSPTRSRPRSRAGVFDAVVVSTDTPEIAEVARRYGAEVPVLRPAELATATVPRHRVGPPHARRLEPRATVRLLLDPAADEPVPARRDDPRARSSSCSRSATAPTRSARSSSAASTRRRCGSSRASWMRPLLPQPEARAAGTRASTRRCRRLRAELEPRDRLDARVADDRRRSPADASRRS